MNEEQFRTGVGVQHGPFNYMAEADKKCSVIFRPDQIETSNLISVLGNIAGYCEELNLFKKLLVRGKTPAELGLEMPKPWDSLDTHFDRRDTEPGFVDILHGLVGAITEAGEMAELLVKWIEQGQLDLTNVVEEAGDEMWYLSRMFFGIQKLTGKPMDFDVCGKININKLNGRHGDVFNVERDSNRNLGAERDQLEADFIGTAQEALAPSVKSALGIAEQGERKGPIGDCEGMDC